jgi:hypothetical protein
MENRINIAELLKDCPQGMELDCTIYDNVTLEYVTKSKSLPICVRIQNKGTMFLSKYGQVYEDNCCKCVIFPKGKTTWEGILAPFSNGDIVATDDSVFIGIVRKVHQCDTEDMYSHYEEYSVHCYIEVSDDNGLYEFKTRDKPLYFCRLATKEEKQKLFDAIKENGYRWNAETKTLEKVVPKFKVGNRVKTVFKPYQYVIKGITDTHYTLEEVEDKFQYTEPIIEDENWELVPNKFDITTLKPFDKVLVRCSTLEKWHIQLFEKYDKTYQDPFICIGCNKYKQCIPYEGNEHLLDKADDCNEYFKTWE